MAAREKGSKMSLTYRSITGTTPTYTRKEYTASAPMWRYLLTCGHEVRYRVRLEVNSYGYCMKCTPARRFRYTPMTALEIAPSSGDLWDQRRWEKWNEEHPEPERKRPRTLSAQQVEDAMERAILKERIARLIVTGEYGWHDAYLVVNTLNGEALVRYGMTRKQFTLRMVREVMHDYGVRAPKRGEEEAEAA